MQARKTDYPLIIDCISVPVVVTTPDEFYEPNKPTLEQVAKVPGDVRCRRSSDFVHADGLQYTITAQSTPDTVRSVCINQHYLDYAGLSAEQVSRGDWMAAVHPDDVDELTASWKRIKAGQKPEEIEARLRRFDGVYRWFLFRFSPLRDESGSITNWYGTTIDIDDRKRAQEELRRSEVFLAEAQRISASGSFSWRLDTDGITFSEELRRIFEFDLLSPVTLDQIDDRVHPEDGPLLSDKRAEARSIGADHDYEIRLVMPDGSIKYVHIVSHRVRDHDDHEEYIGMIQDVTQRHVAEEALRALECEVARMARFNSLGALTASIVREASQQLAGIIANANTCLRMLAAEPPNVDGALETARRTIGDGNRASNIIARVSSLLENRHAATETMNPKDAMGEVVAPSRNAIMSSRESLSAELGAGVPRVTTMDLVNGSNRKSIAPISPNAVPTVFVVDDDISVRKSLEAMICVEGWQAETFASAHDFLARPRVLAPSCLVLDISLSDASGLDLQKLLAVERGDMPIIFISGYGDVPTTVQAMKAGAIEFLTKPFDYGAMRRAIQDAIDHSHAALKEEEELRWLRDRFESLSAREREVMTLVATGLLNKQVGGKLGISESTVKAHRGRVMHKMKAGSLPDLVNFLTRLCHASAAKG